MANSHPHSSTFRYWDLSRRCGHGGTWRRTWERPNRRGGDRVGTISLLGCSTSVALAAGPTDEEEPWFDEECLGFLDQRKRAKMQRIKDPSQNNVDILNNVRCEVSRHFRNKKAYLRAKIQELETNSKIQNIRDLYRGINYFKKGYQPRCNIVKDEKGDLVADSHSIVARWRNYFSQLFNVKDVRQAEIHAAEPLVPEPSAAEVELAIDKL